MVQLLNNQATLIQLLLLYFIELVTLVYLLRKYNKSTLYILIILLFYPAIFSFIGKNFQDLYKIIMLAFTLWECNKRRVFASFKKEDNWLTVFFIAFSSFYAVSAFTNHDSWTIIISQYSRYLIAYCLWFLVRKQMVTGKNRMVTLQRLTYELILMQIIISLGKLFIFGGRQIENIVGSISHTGGESGTTIPILGFILLWLYKRGVYKKNDWLFVIGLTLIGFLAGKRAVWFIMPVVISAFMIYVPKLKMNKTLWITIILAPVAFYLGMRLTPTLNPEGQVWGSFDLDYAFNYANKYQFGDKTKKNSDKAQGRGGATLAVLYRLYSDKELTEIDWFGSGLNSMYTTDYEQFDKAKKGININYKGSASGIYQTYATTGYFGVFTTVLLFFSMLWRIKMKRIRWVLMGIVAWEYFLYTGSIFRTPAFMFLIIYFIHYSNFLFQKPKQTINSQLSVPYSYKIQI